MMGDDIRNLFHSSTLFAPFQNKELRRFQSYFDAIEKQPLTALQRRAVILNDKRNLVVAGAGKGKDVRNRCKGWLPRKFRQM